MLQIPIEIEKEYSNNKYYFWKLEKGAILIQ